MVKTFRIFGDKLGEDAGYLDVEVTGVSRGNAVLLTDTDTGTEYRIDLQRLETLMDDALAYDLDNIDTNKGVWKAIDNLSQNANGQPHYDEAIKALFRGAA